MSVLSYAYLPFAHDLDLGLMTLIYKLDLDIRICLPKTNLLSRGFQNSEHEQEETCKHSHRRNRMYQ